jgi:putrescine transport system permease protein
MNRIRWSRGWGRRLVGLPPYGWLCLFFLAPILIIVKISVADMRSSIPPYTPLLTWIGGRLPEIHVTWASYRLLLSDDLYVLAYLNSLKIAAISAVCCLVIGYPMAYAIARAPSHLRNGLLMMVVLPFWTSLLIRVYAWMSILKNEGLLNRLLLWSGVIDQPVQILETDLAVYIGIVCAYLPFMVLPLYATLEKLDPTLLEAAADLGCRPFRAFLGITVPLSVKGMAAGIMLVFIPAVGEFVIPDLLGGPDTLMISKVLWSEFFDNRDWPMASAVAVVMLIALVLPIMILHRLTDKDARP